MSNAQAQGWVTAPPLYGTFHLTTGFTPDPHSVGAVPIVFDPFVVNGLFSTGVDILVADGTSVTTEVGITYPLTCDSDVSCGGGSLTFGGGTAFSF